MCIRIYALHGAVAVLVLARRVLRGSVASRFVIVASPKHSRPSSPRCCCTLARRVL